MGIKAGLSVNMKDKLGRTALMDAAEIGSLTLIDVMMQYGADLNLEDDDKNTAISYSLDYVCTDEQKWYDTAEKLVNGGADPNYGGKFTKRMFLHYVAAKGDLDLVKELIEKRNAFSEPLDNSDKTPLIYAQENEHYHVTAYFQKE